MENKDSKVWDIMVKSDLLNEILERTPVWIIRWGNTLFLVFIITLFTLAAFIQYPDVITARAELTTQQPPIEVKTLVTAKIDSLFFSEKDKVKSGDLLVRLHALADYQDVLRAEKAINDGLAVEKLSRYPTLELPQNLQLGSLATSYNDLTKAFTQFRYFLQQNYVFKKIASIEKEVEKIKLLNTSLNSQEKIHAEEVKLSELEHQRNIDLREQGLISAIDLENSQGDLLRIKREFEKARMDQINNDLQIERLSIQKEELLHNRNQDINNRIENIRELFGDLHSLIQAWKENFLIYAPIDGELVFDERWSLEQPLNIGQTIFNIIPTALDNQIIGICQMPSRNSGGVEAGDTVQLRLDAFPYQEYGVIEATIASLPLMNRADENAESFSRVELTFNEPLRTTSGTEVEFTQRMTGTALIIKEKRSILERIFSQIINLLQN